MYGRPGAWPYDSRLNTRRAGAVVGSGMLSIVRDGELARRPCEERMCREGVACGLGGMLDTVHQDWQRRSAWPPSCWWEAFVWRGKGSKCFGCWAVFAGLPRLNHENVDRGGPLPGDGVTSSGAKATGGL